MIRIGDISAGDTVTAKFHTNPAGDFTITGTVRKQPSGSARELEGFVLWLGGRRLLESDGFVEILEHERAIPPEPELHTVHADADGDPWIRTTAGWRLIEEIEADGDVFPWAQAVKVYGPMTPITRVI